MECNGIFYTKKKVAWNIIVPSLEFTLHFNRLLQSLASNEQVKITVFDPMEPIEDRAGTVYKNVSSIREIAGRDPEVYDIEFDHKKGTFSFRLVFKDVPKEFIFYDLDSLEEFSLMESSSEYTSIDLYFFAGILRRINITKEVIPNE